jgi:hypothetical protein
MTTVLLAIDDVSLPFRKKVCLYLNKPDVRPEPVLTPSPKGSGSPDDVAAHFYGTVLHDAGKFRMWYYACHQGVNPDWPARMKQQLARMNTGLSGLSDDTIQMGPVCYAESDDGIHWSKPPLGQVLFKGNRENNAIDLPHTLVCGVAVIRDDADPDPARRYKMVYEFLPEQTEPPIPEYGSVSTIACAVSPDGLRWTVTAIPFPNQFVEPCSFIRHRGQYITHYQVTPGDKRGGVCDEGGTFGGRTGMAHVTHDFDHWPDVWVRAFGLPEPVDRSDVRYDQAHLGVGAASFGNVCVGLYGLWHNHPFGDPFGRISCDLGLVVSNDGVHFREPGSTPGQAYIHRDDSPVPPVPGGGPNTMIGPFNTILCQGNGILNVGDETRIYHGRWRNMERSDLSGPYYHAEIALATLPRDRWGALGLNPGAGEGTICSAPVTLPAGCAFTLNADGVAGLTIELLDEQFRPLPGFAGGQVAGPDGLDCPVRWKGHALSELGGRPVRIQVKMKRTGDYLPRVYALYVNETRS